MEFKDLNETRIDLTPENNAPEIGLLVEFWDFGQVRQAKLLLTNHDKNGVDILQSIGQIMRHFDIDSVFGNREPLFIFQRALNACMDGYLSRFDIATVSLDELSLGQKVDAVANFAEEFGTQYFEADEYATLLFLAKHPVLSNVERNFGLQLYIGTFGQDE